jgi:putative spermidine/putrescine transport system permease protein
MVLTVILSLSAGMAFRRHFALSAFLFYATISSLIVPSIVISLGVALEFRILDDLIKAVGVELQIQWIMDDFRTTMGLLSSGLGAQLTWTLPFGLLIMFAVFNRFDPSYEEAARDLGAGPWQTFKEAVLPIIAPSLIGVALFGFTLSYDELARSSQAIGGQNTLPLELRGLTTTVTDPTIYALGTLTTAVSFLAIAVFLSLFVLLRRRTSKSIAQEELPS